MMKKNILAASLALALGSVSGVASAAWQVNPEGIGHYNLVPYYTVQDGSNTLINIVNTDTTNGKVVKVRFRAAEWSDDALDFQVFMSPGDVWTGAIGEDGGVPKLVSSDNSCTLPAGVGKGAGTKFPTTRVEGREGSRLFEGYVEIFVMGDIPPVAQNVAIAAGGGAYTNTALPNPLYVASKHVNGEAPCTAAIIGPGLRANNTLQGAGLAATTLPATADTVAAEQQSWMAPSTGGLMTNTTIIKVDASRAFAIPATAIAGDTTERGAVGPLATDDISHVQYFRQSDQDIGALVFDQAGAANHTADRMFYPVGRPFVDETGTRAAPTAADGGAAYPIKEFDLPDLSTPFNIVDTAAAHRDALAILLAAGGGNAAVEYNVEPGLAATTDVVLSQPLRRYYYDYTATAVGFNRTITGSQNAVKTFEVGGEAATYYAGITLDNMLPMTASVFYDREEQTATSGLVVSPSEPGDPVALKGEVSVISVKNGAVPTGSLGAVLTANNWEFEENYHDGWAQLSLTESTSNTAIPVIGFSAINMYNAGAGANGTNYGQIHPLRKF